MKSYLTLITLVCLSNLIDAIPYAQNSVPTTTAVVSSGCSWCTPGPWSIDPACLTGEYSAVASSILNPPASVVLNASSFCSTFLRPLFTDTVNTTGGTTTSTSTVEIIVFFTPTPTAAASTTSIAKTTAPSPLKSAPASPAVTSSTTVSKTAVLQKRDFTVPDYLTAWYYYGRIDPGCSCIITSAAPNSLVSTETSTLYNVTISTAVTVTYTLYP